MMMMMMIIHKHYISLEEKAIRATTTPQLPPLLLLPSTQNSQPEGSWHSEQHESGQTQTLFEYIRPSSHWRLPPLLVTPTANLCASWLLKISAGKALDRGQPAGLFFRSCRQTGTSKRASERAKRVDMIPSVQAGGTFALPVRMGRHCVCSFIRSAS